MDNLFSGYSIRSTSQKLPKNLPLCITRTTYLKDLRVGWVGSWISSVPLPPFPSCVKPRDSPSRLLFPIASSQKVGKLGTRLLYLCIVFL